MYIKVCFWSWNITESYLPRFVSRNRLTVLIRVRPGSPRLLAQPDSIGATTISPLLLYPSPLFHHLCPDSPFARCVRLLRLRAFFVFDSAFGLAPPAKLLTHLTGACSCLADPIFVLTPCLPSVPLLTPSSSEPTTSLGLIFL